MTDRKDDKTGLSDSERKLWLETMRGVQRAKNKPESATKPPRKPGKATTPHRPASPAPLAERPAKAGLTPKSGIDRRTSEKLRRGKMEIEARIDLHGMGREQARQTLTGFILKCHQRKLRTLLVITGKGSLSSGGGVLRRAVPEWLHEPPLAGLVLAVHGAQPRDGGDGAYYVLLRRVRE